MPVETDATLDVVSPGSPTLFPTQGLLLSALSSVHQLCLQVKDRQNASLQLHARLHQVFLRITNCAAHGTLKKGFEVSSFTSILNHFRLVLEQHLRLKNVVLRMLASRRFLASLKKVHQELSALITKWQIASPSSATMVWKQQMAINLHLDEKTLHATLRSLLATTFVDKEYFSERRQLHLLMELVCEFAPERERWESHSPQLLETLKMTHKRISNYSGIHIRRVPRWFLPRSEVDGTEKYKMVGHGSFATTLFRGDYFGIDVGNTGGHPVAVKYLWPLKDVYYTQVEHLFIQTVQEWWHINHPNVAQVRGACHVSSPPYIVRDFAAYGSLTSYIAAVRAHANDPKAGESKSAKIETVMWELLYGACKGLLYLHERRKIVHGGLRCNNILVNKYGQPVLADYGMQALACEVRKHNMDVDAAKIDESEYIRWQAPECLQDGQSQLLVASDSSAIPSSNLNASFASDVYALGMCILEAVTGAVPWSGLEISEVRSLKQNLGVLPPRPKRMHSNVWGLVQKMCVADPKQRVSLRDVLAEIKGLGYVGYASKVQIETPKQSANDEHAPSTKDSEADARVSLGGINDPLSHGSMGAVHEGEEANRVVELDQADQTSEQHDKSQATVPEHRAIASSAPEKNASSLAPGIEKPVSKSSTHVIKEPEKEEPLVVPDTSPPILDQNDQSSDHGNPAAAAETSVKLSGMDKRSADGSTEESAMEQKVYSTIFRPIVAPEKMPPKPHPEILDANGEANMKEKDAVEAHESPTTAKVDEDAREEESGNIWDEKDETVVERASVDAGVVKVIVEYQEVQAQAGIGAEVVPASAPHVGPSEEEVNIFLVRKSKVSPEESPSTASTLEPEHEIESNGASFVDARKDICDLDRREMKPEPVDEAPFSLTSELRNRIKSNGPNFDRSSFLDNLLRATTLRTEYMTANEINDVAPPPLSTPKFVDLVEALKVQDQPEFVLHALGMLRNGLRQDKRDVDWTERGGILALLQIIRKNISEKCTCLALDILVEIAVQNPEDIEAMVDSGVVNILLSFIERRDVSDELDLVASFLLEILAKSDNAKNRLWGTEGLKVLEANAAIDRRLVQEIKSIMAKYKSRYVKKVYFTLPVSHCTLD